MPMRDQQQKQHTVVVGGRRLSIEDVCAVSRGASLALSTDKAYIGRIERGAQVFIGEAAEYEVSNVVDPSFTVAAKIRKSLLPKR